jgi:hypothetical protein
MEHDQLLLAMGGIVKGIDVQCAMARRLVERLDE